MPPLATTIRAAMLVAAGLLALAPAPGRAASGGTPPTPPVVIPDVPGAALAAGPLAVRLARRAVAFAGPQGAELTYAVGGDAPARVRVDLVREADGALVARWGPAELAPGAVASARWSGWAPRPRRVAAPDGRYRFAVYADDAPVASDWFQFVSHVFPVRGPHHYGTAINRFGAPRGARSHLGHDVMAGCGLPLVAARGGIVKAVGTGGAAGNYVVVHERGPGWDAAYMHLRQPAAVAEGQPVYTGQLLGYVGRTGDASACHLHFELWTAPGWWSGGHAVDPLPSLRAWDRATARALRAVG